MLSVGFADSVTKGRVEADRFDLFLAGFKNDADDVVMTGVHFDLAQQRTTTSEPPGGRRDVHVLDLDLMISMPDISPTAYRDAVITGDDETRTVTEQFA